MEESKFSKRAFYRLNLLDDPRFVIASSIEKGGETYQVEPTNVRFTSRLKNSDETSLCVANSKASFCLAGTEKGNLIEFAPLDGVIFREMTISKSPLTALTTSKAFTPYVGTLGGEVFEVDLAKGAKTLLGSHENRVISLFILENLIGSFGMDNQLKVWDSRSRKSISSKFCIPPQPNGVAVSGETLYFCPFQKGEQFRVCKKADLLAANDVELPKLDVKKSEKRVQAVKVWSSSLLILDEDSLITKQSLGSWSLQPFELDGYSELLAQEKKVLDFAMMPKGRIMVCGEEFIKLYDVSSNLANSNPDSM